MPERRVHRWTFKHVGRALLALRLLAGLGVGPPGPAVTGAAFGLSLGAVALTSTPAGARSPPLILRALRLGQVRLAHRELLRALVKEGDDPDIIAIFGATLARAGFSGDAVATFDFALGSDWYEQQGLGDHADALRELGRGSEAAQLRLGVLMRGERSATVDAQVMMEIAEDHLSVGDLDEALLLAERAIAWGPASPLPYCALGRVLRARGDTEGAWEALQLADRAADRKVAALELLRARLLLDEGLYEEAIAALESLPRGRNDNLQVWALRAEISLQEGLPEDALQVLEHERLGFQASPILAELRARALIGLGRAPEARAVAAEALRSAPLRPSLRAIVDALDATLAPPPIPE